MPLLKGKSRTTVGKNIGRLIREGYDPRQAAAIAYSTAGISRKVKTMAKRRKKASSKKGWSPSKKASYKKARRALINKFNRI